MKKKISLGAVAFILALVVTFFWGLSEAHEKQTLKVDNFQAQEMCLNGHRVLAIKAKGYSVSTTKFVYVGECDSNASR